MTIVNSSNSNNSNNSSSNNNNNSRELATVIADFSCRRGSYTSATACRETSCSFGVELCVRDRFRKLAQRLPSALTIPVFSRLFCNIYIYIFVYMYHFQSLKLRLATQPLAVRAARMLHPKADGTVFATGRNRDGRRNRFRCTRT